jgi:biotin synthase
MSASFDRIEQIYRRPLFELVQEARAVTARHWPKREVQLCTLLSIKTGGCSEDCGYCAQSVRHHTGLEPQRLMNTEEIMKVARAAKSAGATRFCMGAAWKGVREGDARFESVVGTVREVSRLGMEVCVTLGQLTDGAAERLREAGVTAYNHNIDTSPEYYPEIVSTHTFEDRLQTIRSVQKAGMAVCCGGIIGMGESVRDRLRMVEILAQFDPPPESIPINCLVPIAGTPMEGESPVDIFELVRLIATIRLLFPASKVRLSAGRERLTREGQALCFFAGANSIFFGNRLLTTSNPDCDEDLALLRELGLNPNLSSPIGATSAPAATSLR